MVNHLVKCIQRAINADNYNTTKADVVSKSNKLVTQQRLLCSLVNLRTFQLSPTDMYEVPDVVPPIHAVSSHVATDKDPSKFRSIFSDNLQPIATRRKIARGTLLVDIGCSSEHAPPPFTTKLAAAIYRGAVVSTR